MKRVITYGTFDLLHYGHINLLKRSVCGKHHSVHKASVNILKKTKAIWKS